MSIDMMLAASRVERDEDQRRRDAEMEKALRIPDLHNRVHEFDADCQAAKEVM